MLKRPASSTLIPFNGKNRNPQVLSFLLNIFLLKRRKFLISLEQAALVSQIRPSEYCQKI